MKIIHAADNLLASSWVWVNGYIRGKKHDRGLDRNDA